MIDAEVSIERFEETLAFFEGDNEQKAQLFAKQIGAESCQKEGDFYQVVLS